LKVQGELGKREGNKRKSGGEKGKGKRIKYSNV